MKLFVLGCINETIPFGLQFLTGDNNDYGGEEEKGDDGDNSDYGKEEEKGRKEEEEEEEEE